jgi:cyclic-di-GMP-binding protein
MAGANDAKVRDADNESPIQCLSLAEVERFLAELPKVDTQRSAYLIYQALMHCSTITIAPEEQLEALGRLGCEMADIMSRLQVDYQQQVCLNAKEKRSMLGRMQSMDREIAEAYSRLYLDYPEHLSAACRAKAMTAAVSHWANTIIRANKSYLPAPHCAWKNIYGVYRLSQDEQYADHRNAIQNELLKVSLFSCTQPMHCSLMTLGCVQKHLSEWIIHCEINSDIDDASTFVIDLDSDRPPAYRQMFELDKIDSGIELNLKPLLQFFNELSFSDRELLRQSCPGIEDTIIPAWEGYHDRQNKRLEKNALANIALGMKACHYHIGDSQEVCDSLNALMDDDEAEENADNNVVDLPVENSINFHDTRNWGIASDEDYDKLTQRGKAADEGGPDPWSVDYRPQNFQTLYMDLNKKDAVQHHPLYPVTIADSSFTGYCFTISGHALQPGSLLGIKVKDVEQAPWQIAIVRWVKSGAGDKFRCGIELLAVNATSVAARCISSKHADAPFMPSLLLPTSHKIHEAHSIILPAWQAHLGETYRIVNSHIDVDIVLEEFVLETSSVKQCRFSLVSG